VKGQLKKSIRRLLGGLKTRISLKKMISLKSSKEIEVMAKGGRRLAQILAKTLKEAQPGVSLNKLDQLVDFLIRKSAGQPSFKMVDGYHWATCLNVNEGIVHGVPNDYRLKDGDLLSVDLGIFYQGFHTDMAWTIKVGKGKESLEKKKFLEAGKKALKEAIKMARPGYRIGHLSEVIEKEIKKAGYQPVKNLTGHGVGQKLHEDPPIPCFLKEKIAKTARIRAGMTLAIEVIYTQGQPEMSLEADNWTLKTLDGRLAGLFEKSIAVTRKGPLVLTEVNLA